MKLKYILLLSRRKLTKEDIPQIKSNIKKLELDWQTKWAECLSHTPLSSFLNDDPVSLK